MLISRFGAVFGSAKSLGAGKRDAAAEPPLGRLRAAAVFQQKKPILLPRRGRRPPHAPGSRGRRIPASGGDTASPSRRPGTGRN